MLKSIFLLDDKDWIGATIIVLLAIASACSSWAMHEQFALGLTYVSFPILIASALAILKYIISSKHLQFLISDYYLMVLLLVEFFSYFWSVQPLIWAINIYWYLLCAMTFFLVRFYATTLIKIRIVGFGVLIGMYIGSSLITEQVNEWNIITARQMIDGVNSNLTAYIFASSFFIIVVLAYFKMWPRWFFLVLIPLSAYVFYKMNLLGTRGALLSCYLLAMWVFISRFPIRRIFSILIYILITYVLMFSFGLIDELLNLLTELFVERQEDVLSGRAETWNYARRIIMDNFFNGIGVGAFDLINPYEMGAHNFFLSIAVDIGIPGLVLFLVFIYHIIKPALVLRADSHNQFVCGAFLLHWLPIAGSGYVHLFPFTWLLFALTSNLLRLEPKPEGRVSMKLSHSPNSNLQAYQKVLQPNSGLTKGM